MKIMKFKKYIFEPQNSNLLRFMFGLILSITLSFSILSSGKTTSLRDKKIYRQNINVMIPEGHVLFPFTAQNYSELDGVLDAYSLVKVYEPKNGQLIAENIKVLRAPKDPSQLAFLIPSKVANKFMEYGMDFRLALQKFTNNKPKLITINQSSSSKLKRVVTYGE